MTKPSRSFCSVQNSVISSEYTDFNEFTVFSAMIVVVCYSSLKCSEDVTWLNIKETWRTGLATGVESLVRLCFCFFRSIKSHFFSLIINKYARVSTIKMLSVGQSFCVNVFRFLWDSICSFAFIEIITFGSGPPGFSWYWSCKLKSDLCQQWLALRMYAAWILHM